MPQHATMSSTAFNINLATDVRLYVRIQRSATVHSLGSLSYIELHNSTRVYEIVFVGYVVAYVAVCGRRA